MKSARYWIIATALAVASVAFGLHIYETVVNFNGGIYVHPKSIATSSGNKVTRMLEGTVSLDFLSATTTCTTLISDGGYSTLTLTGAQAGDPCFVGPYVDGGATHSNFSCYVSAANEVTVKACSAGTASDPAMAQYKVRVISSQ